LARARIQDEENKKQNPGCSRKNKSLEGERKKEEG